MDISHYKELFTVCREYGIQSVHLDSHTGLLSAAHFFPKASEEPLLVPGEAGRIPTEEEFLFAATEGLGPKEEEKPRIQPEGDQPG